MISVFSVWNKDVSMHLQHKIESKLFQYMRAMTIQNRWIIIFPKCQIYNLFLSKMNLERLVSIWQIQNDVA